MLSVSHFLTFRAYCFSPSTDNEAVSSSLPSSKHSYRRTMSDSQAKVNPASISARSRRTSVSAIPRPISGTSRHATPSVSRAGQRESPAETAPLRNLPSYRKSWHPNNGLAPSSFRTPDVQVSPPTEYTIPYKQRSQHDLSGTQQQLYIRNLSTHSLNVPDTSTGPRLLKQISSSNAIPKSKTTSNLWSPSRDSMPGRRLMQPIGPPLPRTQTLGNISCFNQSSSTPSPRKSKAVSLSPPHHHHHSTSQVNVAAALGESRMTEQEMGLMKQVQKEAAANRARLRTAHHQHNLSNHTISEASTASRDAPTLIMSTDDVVNTQRLQAMKRKSSSGRFLFIDSTLANKNWQQSEPPSATTMTSIGSITSSDPSHNEEDDPRHVSDIGLLSSHTELLRIN